jgi:hypothetical protein
MDEPMQATPTADMELEQRLDAYARARLNIAPEAAARVRARLMLEARQVLGGGPPTGLTLVGARANGRASERVNARANAQTGSRMRTRIRRSGALLLAAGLAVGVLAGTAAAATPGGPLYGARVWVEEITLPADPAERAAAELQRLESRLVEIQAAAQSGDRGAVAAAIAAYGQIADEALAEAGTDASRLDLLRLALDRHLAVLRGVAATAPAEASEAIQRNIDKAVEHNDATLQKIASQTPPPNANQGGGDGNQNGGGQGGGTGTEPDRTLKPAAEPQPTPTPDSTPKPHPTAKPVATPVPTPVATPDPTPVATPNTDPGGGNRPPKPSPKSGH